MVFQGTKIRRARLTRYFWYVRRTIGGELKAGENLVAAGFSLRLHGRDACATRLIAT
jgi:hypothetical protein